VAEPVDATAVVERVRHEVDADGHPIAVWEKSPATPRGVLVLVHGRTWSGVPDFDLQVDGESLSLMDDMVARGWAAYAVDLRGYGGTPRDDTQWLTPTRAAADLAIVLDWVAQRHQGDHAPALLGWSYGSMVSQLTAQQHPDSISALVLYGYPRDPDQEYAPREAPAEPPRRENTAEAAASDFITPDSISDAAIQAYVQQSLAADPVRVDWKDEHEWSALDPAAVQVPTLVLHGEHDPYAPVANQARLFERLGHPDRQWVIVAGGDHAAHLERPRARFIGALLAFLERPSPP
jgi:pimeloyl-ACP methyl ester carboxylesterase